MKKFFLIFLFYLVSCTPTLLVMDYGIHHESLLMNQKIKNVNFQEKYGIKILRIKRKGEFLRVINSETKILENDTLTILGTNSNINRFRLVYK